MHNLRQLDEALLVEVCRRFIDKMRPADIAKWLSEEVNDRVNREEIYPLIREAIDRGYFSILPPANELMRQRIADRYRKGKDKDRIHVVSVTADSAQELLPSYAAELITSRISQIAVNKDCVRIGLGGGMTVRQVAKALAAQLRSAEHLPQLGFHVLTAGFAVRRPRTAPITFLGFFAQVPTDIDYVGLFAPAVVDAKDYARVRTLPGVKESFESAEQIDLIVTSLASADDQHGELNEFMTQAGQPTKATLKALRKAGWVGDLQYHPYSSEAPITNVGASVRAMSLFDLEEVRRFAGKENKHVVVVAGPCGECGAPKHKALRPLLENESLKLWTDVVMDMTTAEKLLGEPR